MAKSETGLQWDKHNTAKSLLLFFAHFLILIGITAAVLLWDKFSDFRGYWEKHGVDYLYALFCMILLVSILYFYFFFESRNVLLSGKNIALVFMILDLYIILAYLLENHLLGSIYARPVAFVALMTFVLVGRKEAIFLNVISALMMLVIDTFAVESTTAIEGYSSLIIAFSAGMIAIFFCEKATTRFRVILIGILIVIPIDCIIFLLGLSSLLRSGETIGLSPWQNIFMNMGYGLAGGVMSTVFFLTILPVFEGAFNCLTVFRLRELTSPDAKVLKRLKTEAPGTYNHCMMVAQLAEACATAIGENIDYARAAALYHDVGKLHHPEYFTENQGDYNLHDELLPELSADMIRSHAVDGYALIKKNHLPDFLADVALQHHGTLPIRYFYAKALKLTDGELNIEDFSYAGPKPQTKIAAIIMIADAAEAVVRATGSRTPDAAEKVIRGIIEERMDLEQFSECDITMVDLTKIRLALVNALTGVYHHRIKYPNIKYKQSSDGKFTGENA